MISHDITVLCTGGLYDTECNAAVVCIALTKSPGPPRFPPGYLGIAYVYHGEVIHSKSVSQTGMGDR